MGYPKKHRGRRKRGSKFRRNKKRQKMRKKEDDIHYTFKSYCH